MNPTPITKHGYSFNLWVMPRSGLPLGKPRKVKGLYTSNVIQLRCRGYARVRISPSMAQLKLWATVKALTNG